ncbi:hypothetical protein M231_01304 [Tremella mesenterica]|uniref:Uncharacterized protein n=1 Tax=Tremella mesenterica TaxID=5217 RepID=A0A4Q1BTJ7_TREME|nr:hypothetical protein M231_01304 [Tremella mesenterica]
MTTLWRKVVRAALHVQPTLRPPTSLPTPTVSHSSVKNLQNLHTPHVSPHFSSSSAVVQNKVMFNIRNIFPVLRKLAKDTFPSISQPSHRLAVQLQPIRISHRGFSTAQSTSRRLGNIRFSRGIGPTSRISQSPGINSLGLNSARGFATSGPASAQTLNNIPVVLRAFASLLDNEDLSSRIPKASRYTPYSHLKSNGTSKRLRRRHAPCINNRLQSWKEEVNHYFPLPIPRITSTRSTVNLPPLPETLITEGINTILSVPLSPSLHTLLSPTTTIPYSEAEVGVSILARLTKGLLPLHEAFASYASTRIIPLLAKLDGLGVLGENGKTSMEVLLDTHGIPDILRIVFEGRSHRDVRQLLGESLRVGEEGQWWVLQEFQKLGKTIKLDPSESRDILERWDSPSYSHPEEMFRSTNVISQEERVDQLIFPTIDLSDTMQITSMGWDDVTDISDNLAFASSPTSSGSLTPQSDISISPSLLSSSPETSIWQVSRTTESRRTSLGSVIASQMSDGWTEGDVSEHVSEDGASQVDVRWSGQGEGFGFAQPW